MNLLPKLQLQNTVERIVQKEHTRQELKNKRLRRVKSKLKKQRNSPSISTRTFEYMTVKDVALSLKCDPRTIYDMIRDGRLNAINLSDRKIRVMKKDVDALFCNQSRINNEQNVSIDANKQPAVKDCYTIGEILSRYDIAEAA